MSPPRLTTRRHHYALRQNGKYMSEVLVLGRRTAGLMDETSQRAIISRCLSGRGYSVLN